MAHRLSRLLVVLSLVAAPGVPAWADPGAEPGADQPVRTVRLVTGDRVLVSEDGDRVSLDPSPARPGMRFVAREVDGHRHVIPVDALPLLAEGRLDPRLFDVTQLVRDGYDQRPDLPLLLTYPEGATASHAGLVVTAESPATRTVAVRQNHSDAVSTWRGLVAGRPGVEKVWLDGMSKVSLDVSVPRIGAPAAWAAGYRGAGTAIGIIDTGVDDTHPDLVGKVVERVDFTSEADNIDHHGHGTHVASIAVGTGAAQGGKHTGVAPEAKLYVAKACRRSGNCQDSAVLQAMDWLAAKGVKVVNMSIGGANRAGSDPLESAVEAHPGTLFVAASGNEAGLTDSPASAPGALAVGAVDDTDVPAAFSNRGVVLGDLAVKPEISAPGVGIVAARAGTGSYAEFSGTSMATPHVAGAAALLAQRHPDWSPARLKQGLVASAGADVRNWFATGAGRLDAARAVGQAATAEPAALSFGVRQFPYRDPVRRTVTYHNDGSAPLRLDLKLDAMDSTGAALPGGFLAVDSSTITVPAGGSAAVTVTMDPKVAVPIDRYLGGVLSATADGTSLRTPMTAYLEPEMHTLTIKAFGWDGNPTNRAYTYFISQGDRPGGRPVYHPDGIATLRLPKGRYTFDTLVYDGEWETGTQSMLVAPRVVMDRDQTIVVDVRTAKPLAVTAPEPDAAQTIAQIGLNYRVRSGEWYLGDTLLGFTFERLYAGQVGPDDPDGMISGSAAAGFLRKNEDGSTLNSPYAYNLAWHSRRGTFFDGFNRTFAPKDLAVTEARYAAAGPGERTSIYVGYKPVWDTKSRWLGFRGDAVLPLVRTEYYAATSDVEYGKSFRGIVDDANQSHGYAPFTTMVPGRTTKETWNLGVLGPAFPENSPLDPWDETTIAMSRQGDTLTFAPSLATDSSTHVGIGYTRSASARLTRDGVVVAENTRTVRLDADVPPGDATYQFSAARQVPGVDFVSRSITARWTFRSAHVAGERARNLPLSAVRFTPRLDLDQRAPAGRIFAVPFTIQHQPDSSAGVTREFDLQVSFDDGATWVKPAYVRTGDAGVALVRNPPSGGSVSLKASAADANGNRVDQTIIRAYRT
ncbi:S8 family peptidase [Saccharothrix obliqua]|uniref:S8 family peptidase n=1 Tax=Saccharothrix obliqua TaxID=2861747 RepID=UPI001C5D7EE7|nr:S8 family serine peptidase [Saccharothrix obliqua]MBW4721568.1 S8 family serine peptidase [Saccharothrix obliqua]